MYGMAQSTLDDILETKYVAAKLVRKYLIFARKIGRCLLKMSFLKRNRCDLQETENCRRRNICTRVQRKNNSSIIPEWR